MGNRTAMTTAQGTTTYNYNAANQLTNEQPPVGDSKTYSYDQRGNQTGDGSSSYRVGYNTLGWQTGDTWTYVLPDALGSVRQETDAHGALTDAREWSPFGEELGTARSGLGFTGEWYDPLVGLTYLRARWYDAGTGRFTQVDPWEGDQKQPVSLHAYLYVSNSPVNRVDPSGLIDPLVWSLALQGMAPSGILCPSSSDFQPLADYNIRLGSPEADNYYNYDSEEAWNYAPFKVIQGVDMAIRGYLRFAGSSFTDRMSQVQGGRVTVVFAPPGSAGKRPSYTYPDNQPLAFIKLPSDVLTQSSLIASVVGKNTPEKVEGTVAHELTHIIAQKLLNCSQVEHNYCDNVRGAFVRGVYDWQPYQVTYPNSSYFPGSTRVIVDCPTGTKIEAAPEAIANMVALYIVQAGNLPSSVTRYKNELSNAFDWVKNYYHGQVIGQ